MKLIILPLIILSFIMVLVQAHGHISINPINQFEPNAMPTGFGGQQNLNGSNTDYSTTTQYGVFSPDTLNGIIAVVIAIVAVGALVGIRVLGSGLSDTTVQIIYKSLFYYTIWGICSIFALNGVNNDGLNSIPNGIGYLFYFLMTLFYSIGIVLQIGTSQGGAT